MLGRLGNSPSDLLASLSLFVIFFGYRLSFGKSCNPCTMWTTTIQITLVLVESLPFKASSFALKPLDHFEETVNGQQVLWILFDTDLLLVPGMLIEVASTTASIPMIHDSLLALWRSRWQKLSEVSDPTWSRVLGFARSHLPCLPPKRHPLTVDLLQNTMTTGQGLRTRGPDGWDRQDLRVLPRCYWADIVQLLHQIEGGACWPDQWTFGIVTSLAKKSSPIGVVDYRPITLLDPLVHVPSCKIFPWLRRRELMDTFAIGGAKIRPISCRPCLSLSSSWKNTMLGCFWTSVSVSIVFHVCRLDFWLGSME